MQNSLKWPQYYLDRVNVNIINSKWLNCILKMGNKAFVDTPMHLYKPGRIRQTVTRILLWCYNNIFRMFVLPSGSTSPESALEMFPPKGSSIAMRRGQRRANPRLEQCKEAPTLLFHGQEHWLVHLNLCGQREFGTVQPEKEIYQYA